MILLGRLLLAKNIITLILLAVLMDMIIRGLRGIVIRTATALFWLQRVCYDLVVINERVLLL